MQSNMYHRQMRCFDCHEVHGNDYPELVTAKGNTLCLQCHAPDITNAGGLHTSVAEHTHHPAASKGSECTACHMPLIAQTIKDNYVTSHTFRFITPTLTQQTGIPNPCTSCHKDKTNAWATEELKKWNSVSPWRMTGSTM